MIGTNAITTRVYALNLMMFIFLFSIAIGQGTQILIGIYMGAKRYTETHERALGSIKIALPVSTIMAILLSIFSKQLFSLFTNNQEIITIGSTLIFLTIFFEPGRAINIVIISSLRATGDVLFPLKLGIIFMWGVSVLLSFILGIQFGLGLIGIWIAMACGEWLRGVIVLRRWKSKVWMENSFIRS